ncbi:hypothetical protein A0H81_02965 [Grifola frondosa]|uniref:Secreted protein n=1 Tax=Grifola frondosa TaxID=5627 RepID=A0A1C7MIZ6_GRIFR|nr:hypothetical protein A0H81_02965 [Grifola frondosa]
MRSPTGHGLVWAVLTLSSLSSWCTRTILELNAQTSRTTLSSIFASFLTCLCQRSCCESRRYEGAIPLIYYWLWFEL